MREFLDLIAAIFKFIINIIIYALIHYILGYVFGIVINMLIGDKIVEGLNALLGAGRIVKDNIPVITGTISVICLIVKTFTHRN